MELTGESKLKCRISILETQVKEQRADITSLKNRVYNLPVEHKTNDLTVLKKHLCSFLDIPEDEITSGSNKQEHVSYRHAFIFKAIQLRKLNYKQIGQAINMKEQSVYNAVKNLSLRQRNLPEFKEIINDIKDINF